MSRKRKALRPSLIAQDAPDRAGYWWLYCPNRSINAPVEIRDWCSGQGWELYRIGSIYPIWRIKIEDYHGATWYFLGPLLEMVGGDAM